MNKIDVGNICVDCGSNTAIGTGKFVNRIPKDEGYQCPDCQQLECDDCSTKTLNYVLHDGMVYCEDCYEDFTGIKKGATK